MRVTARKMGRYMGASPFRTSRDAGMDHWRMSASEYRAQFDAVVTFSNGGGLRADGFRVDVPGPDVTEQDVAILFISSLNLLMVDSVELRNLSVFAEPPKGTRGGPSDRPAAPEYGRGRIVDLSHPIRDGLITYPGLPAPEIRPYLTRAQSRERYAPGTEFQIDAVTMVGNVRVLRGVSRGVRRDVLAGFRLGSLCQVGLSGWGEVGEAVFEPPAGAVDGDDLAVVQEAVQDGGGEDFVGEDLAPLAEGLVAGDDD